MTSASVEGTLASVEGTLASVEGVPVSVEGTSARAVMTLADAVDFSVAKEVIFCHDFATAARRRVLSKHMEVKVKQSSWRAMQKS